MDRDQERMRLIDQMHLRTAASLGGVKDPEKAMFVKLPEERSNGNGLSVAAKTDWIFRQLAKGE